MITRVVFTHDEVAKKWDCHVEGVVNHVEARQAFSAVALTCQMLNPNLLQHTKAVQVKNEPNNYKITAAM